jgi:hypothetical protein
MSTSIESKERVTPHLAIIIDDLPPMAKGWKNILESSDVEIILSPISIPGLIDFLDNFNDADLSRTRLVILDTSFVLNTEEDEGGIVTNFLKRLKDINPQSFVMERSGNHIYEAFSHSDVAYNLDFSDRLVFQKIIRQQPSFYLKYLKFKTYLSPESLSAQKIDPKSEWCRTQGHEPTEEDLYQSSMKLIDHYLFPYLASMFDIGNTDGFYDILKAHPLEKALDLLHDCWNIIEMRRMGRSDEEISQSQTVLRMSALL